jgi:MFS family permease
LLIPPADTAYTWLASYATVTHKTEVLIPQSTGKSPSIDRSILGFIIFAGALLGACAGLLWTAQGAIMMSYPSEDMKGRYISWFWMIFNLGAVIGGLVGC